MAAPCPWSYAFGNKADNICDAGCLSFSGLLIVVQCCAVFLMQIALQVLLLP